MKLFPLLLLVVAVHLSAPKAWASTNIFTTTRIVDFAATAIIAGKQFGFDLYNFIVPSFQKERENAYVDFEPYAIAMEQFSFRNEPGALRPNNKIVDYTSDAIWYSLYGAILFTEHPNGTSEKSDECYISEGQQESSSIPHFPRLLQHLESIDSMRGLFEKKPDESGIYNFDYPSLPLNGMNPNEDCKKQDPGEGGEPFGNDQVRLSSFGQGGEHTIFGTFLTSIFELITTVIKNPDGTTTTTTEEVPADDPPYKKEVLLTKKTKQNGATQLCHAGSQKCNPRNMDDRVEIEGARHNLSETGGVFAGFVGANEQKTVAHNALVEDKVTLFGFEAAKVENPLMNVNMAFTGMGEGACTAVPALLQDKAAFGNNTVYKLIKEWCRKDESPEEIKSCDSPYFSQLKAGIEYSQQGRPANAGYTLPYRDTSQAITEAIKEKAKELAATGYSGGQTAVDNIENYWDDINDTAEAYGWSPVFVLALWIEESGAGGHPNASHDLGCLYGWDKSGAQGPAVSMPRITEGSVCDQMACLFSHPVKNKDDFSGFMCSYNSDTTSVNQYQCQASNGWPFAQNLKLVYDILIAAE